ncbi:phosphoribosylglycinamide formyltransferase [Kaarinaea lacus]
MNTTKPIAVVVLISGNGSNLQALIDAAQQPQSPFLISAVISNVETAYGLKRAQHAGIPTHVLAHRQFKSRESFDQSLQRLVDQYDPGLLVLAGFMRILSEAFVRHYEGKMLNIHPSLLPKYPGLNTHQRAIDAGDKEHGATVHFVTHELDGGPAIIQARVPIFADDTAQSLAQRVLIQEHQIFPTAVRWFAEGRLCLRHNQAHLDGKALHQAIQHNVIAEQ